jgi:hypothetical protein
MTCTDTEKQIMIDLADQFVIRKHKNFKRNEGIHFCLKIDIESYGYEKDGSTCHPEWKRRKLAYMHYIVTYPHSVYMALGEDENMPPATLFKNTSNHDSCWRSDGFRDLFSTFIEMYDACYSNVPKEHRPSPRSCDYRLTLRCGWLSAPVFDFVEVESVYCEDGYHKDLLSIKNIKKSLTIF